MKPTSLLSIVAALTLAPTVFAGSKSGTLIVLNKGEATVSLIDTGTGRTIKKLPVGVGPHEAACSPDGKRVAVANYGDQKTVGKSLTIIDIPTKAVVKTIDLDPYTRPHGIEWLTDSTLITTSEQRGELAIVDVDSGKVVRTIPTKAKVSHMLALSPDRKTVYTANIASGSISAFNVADGNRIGEVETGAGAEGICVSPSGDQVWVTNGNAGTVSAVDAKSLKVLGTMQAGQMPIRVRFSQNGKTALVTCANSGEIVLFDVGARKETSRLSLSSIEPKLEFGGAPGPMPVGIMRDPSADVFYIATMGANRICVFDLKSQKLTTRFETGPVPDGMAWSPLLPG